MCHITSCLQCGKTTWGGCGRHQHKIKARTPADNWCLCDKHTSKFWRLVIPTGESSAYWTQDGRTRRRRVRARSNDQLPPTSPLVRNTSSPCGSSPSPSARSEPVSIRGASPRSAPQLHCAPDKLLARGGGERKPRPPAVDCRSEAAPGAASRPRPLTPSSCGVRLFPSYFGGDAGRASEGSL